MKSSKQPEKYFEIYYFLFVCFSAAILHIKMLSAPHVKHLMKTHQVRGSILWFPRFRLQQYANLVHQIDLAIIREGGPKSLTLEDLRRACHLRGLNVKVTI